ncbi:MAG: hypothetical protein J2P38_05880, partial [Candidatus Dormibacteraeota bacterium]|nr:hypothetical protein [Candidatus Dormibacteraeota bacterium]
SVSAPRSAGAGGERQAYRIRARAALSAFTNSLVVSLFALIPGHTIGPTALAAGLSGLVFVLAALLSLIQLFVHQWRHGARTRVFLRELGRALLDTLQGRGSLLDLLFLVGLAVVFIIQAIQGAELLSHPGRAGSVQTVSILVVACFLIGITRSWELIGGPSVGVWQQLASLVRQEQPEPADPDRPR